MGLLSYFKYSKVGKLQVLYLIKITILKNVNIGNSMLVLFSKYNLG